VTDGADGRTADLANAFGNIVRDSEDLVSGAGTILYVDGFANRSVDCDERPRTHPDRSLVNRSMSLV
jgi:hypothetical protein